jgi:SAM-dependent methyltransferase
MARAETEEAGERDHRLRDHLNSEEASMAEWWQTFFDEAFLPIWCSLLPPSQADAEADGLWELLKLREGSRVLDAPCGFGRVSRPMAQRGAVVLGVDQSAAAIEKAEQDRASIASDRLRYVVHDLREPLAEHGFDAAYNIFSSIGYGTEDDDLAVFRTLRNAVKPGGLVLVETSHRDLVVSYFSRGVRPAHRIEDGTLVVEEPVFDPIEGRVNTTWYWSGPHVNGSKRASLRVYCATELVALLQRAGLRYVAAYKGCSTEPFVAKGQDMGGRLALLTQRE